MNTITGRGFLYEQFYAGIQFWLLYQVVNVDIDVGVDPDGPTQAN